MGQVFIQGLTMRTAILMVSLLWVMSDEAVAQQVPTVRVVQTSVVVSEPRGDADVVTTVAPGIVLELLDERGSWYLVRPPDSTPREWRTGWINRAMVEVLDAGAGREPRTVPPAELAPRARSIGRQQGMYPSTETTVGWSLLRDFTLSDASDLSVVLGGPSLADISVFGVYVAATENFTSWLGVTADIGVNFFSQDLVGIDIFDFQILTLLVGPKFTYREADRVAPFGQLLMGAAYLNANVPLAGLSESDLDFVFQPGGGIDIALSDRVALRLGGDVRILADNPFAGDAAHQFRFTTGITFRSDFRPQ